MKFNQNQGRRQKQKPSPQKKDALNILITYLILANRSALLAKIYQNGGLPYFPQSEELNVYLERNARLIVEKEGTAGLFEIHPDKDIILELFAPKIDCKEKEIEPIKTCSCTKNKAIESQDTSNSERYIYIESSKNGKHQGLEMTKLFILILVLLGFFYLLKNKL